MRSPTCWISSGRIAAVVGALLLSACAATAPAPDSQTRAVNLPPLSLTDAALLLQNAKGRGFSILDFDTKPIAGSVPRVLATRFEIDSDRGTTTCDYAANSNPEIKDTFTEMATLRLYCRGTFIKIFHLQEPQLESFRHAWKTMLALGAPESPLEQAQFEAALAAFRAGGVGPEIGENVRRHKVLAETAVRDKRLWEAAAAFEEGLTLAPWWPQGNYNLALVFGELRADALAARYMQRYLQLVPDAANARAAQDKIYVWQAEAKRARQRP